MANKIKGIVIEIGADTKPLEKALDGVNKKSKDIQAELKQVDRLLKLDPKNTTLVEQKQKLLAEAVDNTSDKLETLKEAEKQVQKQFEKGEVGEEQYRALQREVISTEQNFNSLEKKLKDVSKAEDTAGDKAENMGNDMKDAGKKATDLGNKLKDTGGKLQDIGGKMSATVTAPIVAGFALAVEGTEELRSQLAMLETNADSAGISTEAIENSLVSLSGISEDSGANVEALSNLLATGFNEHGMTKALDALSGAVIKFPDTLKIEGLADGLQETLATGAATGSFGEMLERMGIDLDSFNEGLAVAIANGTEENYVLATLASTGLADVSKAYKENNKDLVESKESTQEMQLALAELGGKLEPVMTKITDLTTKIVEKFNEMSPTGQNVVLIILAIIAAIGPLIGIVGTVISVFGSLTLIAGGMGIGIGALVGPIALVVAAIAGIIAIGVTLYKNWDTIKEKADSLKEKIKNLFDFEWKLPELKLPHFSMQGEFSLSPPSIPKIGVEWYDKGAIFNRPSIIGVGEKRPEFVGALDDLRYLIRDELTQKSESNYNVVVNNPKPEPASDSIRKTLLKQSYGL